MGSLAGGMMPSLFFVHIVFRFSFFIASSSTLAENVGSSLLRNL